MSLPPEFIHELRQRFTGEVRLDHASRILYSTDASMYRIEPLGVALPKTQDDLQAAVELAAKYKIPILPRGAGSSLGGQAVGHALILDCSRWLDSILEIDPDSRTATVEPGVVLADLNTAAAKFGLTFGPDPASAERATMGGVIGNNATGAHSILYGMSADHVLSADVILGDGILETWDANLRSRLFPVVRDIQEHKAQAIRRNFPKTWRNSAGYRLNYLLPWSPSTPPQWIGETYPANLKSETVNLAPLLAGSEGTLAVMRRATLNLVSKPKYTILAVLSYPSIAEACDDVPRLLAFQPSAVELVPRMILELARSVPAYARQMGWIVGNPAAVLVVEFSGDQRLALKACVERCRNNAVRGQGISAGRAAKRIRTSTFLTIAESKEEQARVWNIRKMGLGILDSRPRSARPAAFIEDCAIPVENLGGFVREVERIMSEHGTEGGIYAHASAGCLHIRPILDLQNGEGVRAMRSIGEQVFALTMRLGGSMSSEHGDGIVSGEWIERTYGKEVTEAMRRLKHTADPDNLLNPQKLFDAPPMDTHLRYGVDYAANAWTASMRFEHERGLAGAIEQCNGQGVCRKTTGVMCPSFQATHEEQNSTRGRANLLRAMIATSWPLRGTKNTGDEAISRSPGTTIPKGRNDITEAVASALDLCLACKGCKAECPSGVDMAKLKYEFENEYYKSHRRPLRDYLFGYFDITARLASAFAPLTNAVMGVPVIKNAIARALGIAEKRPFPKFTTRRTRLQRDEFLHQPAAQTDLPIIVFLSDPFGRYVEPEVEQAAFEVLAACGYFVHVLPVIGAGASLLSKGFVEAARRQACKVLQAMKQVDPGGNAALVGIEPPDIYCLKNDYVDLLPERRDEIASLSARTWFLDEFLVRSDTFRSMRVDISSHIKPNGAQLPQSNLPKVLFHPHCHQQAQGPCDDGLPSGALATVEMLKCCGYEVMLSEAGCCGMAGTFGYEEEHYELSMRVGGLKLFPLLTASGSSGHLRHPDPQEGGGGLEVVASGAACRMQIGQGTGVEALHPILLAAQALTGRHKWFV